MIEQALRRFCESRHRSLIVIAGTFVVGLVLVIPLVDAYSAGRDEKEGLLTELGSAQQVAGELERFESRVTEKLAQLKVLEARTVNDDSLPALRGKLVDLAKETGCSIRRISPGNTMTRAWSPGEDPINPDATIKQNEPGSNFKLEWRPITLSISGSTANLQNLVQRIAENGMLMHTKSFEMYPSSANRQTLTLDLELWYFTLARKG
jgi:hypothetical protein